MSSYDHLHAAEFPPENTRGGLDRMQARLDELGRPRLAAETRTYLQEPSDALRRVWREVERLDSGFGDLQDVERACDAWERGA